MLCADQSNTLTVTLVDTSLSQQKLMLINIAHLICCRISMTPHSMITSEYGVWQKCQNWRRSSRAWKRRNNDKLSCLFWSSLMSLLFPITATLRKAGLQISKPIKLLGSLIYSWLLYYLSASYFSANLLFRFAFVRKPANNWHQTLRILTPRSRDEVPGRGKHPCRLVTVALVNINEVISSRNQCATNSVELTNSLCANNACMYVNYFTPCCTYDI
jgi:hypothetical protein